MNFTICTCYTTINCGWKWKSYQQFKFKFILCLFHFKELAEGNLVSFCCRLDERNKVIFFLSLSLSVYVDVGYNPHVCMRIKRRIWKKFFWLWGHTDRGDEYKIREFFCLFYVSWNWKIRWKFFSSSFQMATVTVDWFLLGWLNDIFEDCKTLRKMSFELWISIYV